MTSASVTRQEQQRSVFISTEHGEVEVPLTFGELVKDMLPPEAGEDVIREITRMCCEKCGQPEGCECVDDVIVSTSWRTSWTWEAIDVIVEIIGGFQRSYFRTSPSLT